MKKLIPFLFLLIAPLTGGALWQLPWNNSAAPSLTAYVTGVTLGTPRNDFTGNVGFKFTASSSFSISQVGRWVISGNSGSHTISIVGPDDTTILATASVNTSGQPAGAYAYVSIGPVSISSGSSYTIVSSETVSADQFLDNDSVVTGTTGVATYVGSAYYSTSPPPVNLITGSSIFGPVNFKY